MTGVVPDGYEAYVRILHPVEYGEHILRWSDVAVVTGRRMHPLVQWWRLVDADEPLNPISALFDADPPHTGELIVPAANALFATLTLDTANPHTTYFGFWTGYSGDNSAHTSQLAKQFDETRKQLVQVGLPDGLSDILTLDAVADLLRISVGHSPGEDVNEDTAYAHLLIAGR